MNHAQVAELVDAHVSGACAARRAGSSPVLGTHLQETSIPINTYTLLFDNSNIYIDYQARVRLSRLPPLNKPLKRREP